MTKLPAVLRPVILPFIYRRVLAFAVAALTLSHSAIADEPPVISNATVTPSSLPYLGGLASVTATVTDDNNSLDIVFIEVRGPSWYSTAMSRGASTPDDWVGGVELSANLTNSPVVWDIYIRALDYAGFETTVLAGRVQVDSQTTVDDPPFVYDPTVAPQALQSTGGPVALSVSATDLYGIQQAYAVVTGPAGATTVVLDPLGGDRFAGTFNAPANPGRTPVNYTVKMTAVDRRNQITTLDAAPITVAAAVAQTGLLKVAPGSLSYGRLKVGSRAWKWILLRNDGKKGTGMVSGVLVAPGAPFYLFGRGARSIPFTLRPGEVTACLVEFRPTAVGAVTARIVIRRNDGQQAGLAVQLSGQGTPRR